MNLNIVVIGLSVTSSWGNGHATTYRALLSALAQRGHTVSFLERDVPWYRDHRDFVSPDGWNVHLYQSLQDLPQSFGMLVRDADLVIIGSYVPDGIAIADWVTSHTRGITAFYDIDTPVTLVGLETSLDYLSAAMIPRFDIYLSFTGGPALGIIENMYGSPMARVLYCSADLDLYQPQNVASQCRADYASRSRAACRVFFRATFHAQRDPCRHACTRLLSERTAVRGCCLWRCDPVRSMAGP
jgi:spore maturation protein CgeB